MTKVLKFCKKSQKFKSKNNLLTSRTAEQHARGQKLLFTLIWSAGVLGRPSASILPSWALAGESDKLIPHLSFFGYFSILLFYFPEEQSLQFSSSSLNKLSPSSRLLQSTKTNMCLLLASSVTAEEGQDEMANQHHINRHTQYIKKAF